MYIGIVGPIATSDLLSESAQQAHKSCPKGRAGAPLVSNLVKEYIARGHKVLAITIDPKMDDDAEPYVFTNDLLTYVIAPSRQRIFRPNGWRMGRTADFYRFERQQMLALLNRYKPDVVHAHWTYEFALAALAYSPNALITIHDNALVIAKYVRTLERLFMLIMARQVFKRGRWFTAVSPYMAESIQNMTDKPVAVVANPVSIPVVRPRQALPDQPVISVVVNGWDDRKNSINALLAFKEITKRHPDCKLWAMGTAFEPNGEAVAFCKKHDIRNINFYGSMRHTEVLDKIAKSTLLLHTSLEESFGMVLVEAMSYGVPVVAGKDSGAVAWVVDDGGLLVDVTRVDAIATATDKLLSDSELYTRTSKRAMAIVRDRFPIEAIADQYIDLYRKHNVEVGVGHLI